MKLLHKRVKTSPHGSWGSPLDLTVLAEKPSPPMYPEYYQGCHYWIEARAKEGGRLVLIRLAPEGMECCLTPRTFNIRTRAHEYGGKCFVLGNGCVYFSNYGDLRLYAQLLEAGAEPVALTAANSSSVAFADLQLSPSGRFLIAVKEAFDDSGRATSSLVALNLFAPPPAPEVIIAEGADFYANPVVDQVGRRLAWVQWSHPDMPWDQSTLFMSDIFDDGDEFAVGRPRSVAGGEGKSVCQLGFYDKDLIFAMDSEHVVDPCDDFWNLYRCRERTVTRLTCDQKEYGAPHWVFGDTHHAGFGQGKLVAKRVCDEGDELVVIDREKGEQFSIDMDFDSVTHLHGAKRDEASEVLLVAGSATTMPQLMSFDGSAFTSVKQVQTPISVEEISIGAPLQYPTRDGDVAHGYFYLPHNTRFKAPDDHLPPLLVMVHGGPTARTTPTLDLLRQYWTGIGFAVLDVNHRGSTGHGRRYRQSLLGKWGQIDIDDIIDGVDFLINQSLVDSGKIFIRGKSAGGYTVLRALTQYPQYFCAGACYYGIGNLSTLAAATHKFESCYTDRLIGEAYDEEGAGLETSEYYKRSPIHFMHRIRSPMILFQGLDDAVVPPSLSREVVAVLTAHNVDHEYVEYPGEGHGFRNSETQLDALSRETRFYRRVLGVDPDVEGVRG